MDLSELEGFRLGAMQAIIDQIESGSETTAVSRLLRSPARIRLIKMTFPQSDEGAKAADAFIKRLNDEVTLLETSRTILGNSATAQRQAVVKKIEQATEVNPIVGITDAINRAIRKDFNNIEIDQQTQIANEMAKILTETNPAKLKKFIDESAIIDYIDTNELATKIFQKFEAPKKINEQQMVFSPFQKMNIQDFIKQDQQMEAIADAGGVANLAGGGIANLTNTIPPESGPMSQGLRSLYNNGRKL